MHRTITILTASAFTLNGMSPGSRYFRYGSMQVDVSDETLRRVCASDAPGCVHLLVVQRNPNKETIVGSGRVEIDPHAPMAAN